jgi:hypothetical protein
MSRHHVEGAIKMVQLNGGLQNLGLDGFLEMVVRKYRNEVGLSDEVAETPCGTFWSNVKT